MNNLYVKYSSLIIFICLLSSSLLAQIHCSSYGRNFNIGITSVGINTIDESTRSYPNYTDNTSISTNVSMGESYDLTVKGDSWTDRDTKVMVWIDWNHDGDFNDSGESFDLGSIKKKNSNRSTTNSPLRINVPVGAKIGDTRMRISGKYNSYPTPCEVNFYGEVEDYTLNVVPSVVGQGFWFKADAGVNGNVTSWTDQSGNGHTANNSGNISKVNNRLNFNPILNFSGVNRQFSVSGTASVQTLLVVNKTLTTNSHLSGLVGMNGDKGVRLGKPSQSWEGNSNNDDWVNTSQGSFGRINGLFDANMVHNFQWHIANLTRSQALSGNYYLGGYYPGRSYSGGIAEVLAVSSAVTNPAQLESYLGIKYGITLGNTASPVDYVNVYGAKIWSRSSVYQNNIAGIAREDSPYALHQKISSSINTTPSSSSDVTMATINNFTRSNQDASRTGLADGDYLLWGDNAGASASWQDKDDYQTVTRKWKLENTGSVGTTYFQVNLNSYPSAVGDYLLIVDDDEDVSNGISNTYVLANTSGDLYSTSFTPPNGTSYFTIGYFSGSNITVADCLGAKTICDAVYDEPSPETIGLGGVLNELPTGDCIPEEKNGIWYSFSPQNTVDANLKFRITPNVNTNDYDWAIFDMTNTTCEDLASIDIITSDVFVSGSTYGRNGWNGPTGADSDQGGSGDCNGPGTGNGPQWNDDVLVKPGHNYMLYVSNWSEEKDGYVISFDQPGGSAIIYDDIPPELDGVVQACYGTNELKVDFTEILPCNSLDINEVSLTIGG
uniref:GEVED domain-containing protein n=1 Tax=Ancylomarina sp. TaxID=1970196 RepID=UPI003562418B